MRLPLLVQIAGFFDYQYNWRESSDFLVFSHGDIYQMKVESETAPFSLMWPVVSLAKSDCRIL